AERAPEEGVVPRAAEERGRAGERRGVEQVVAGAAAERHLFEVEEDLRGVRADGERGRRRRDVGVAALDQAVDARLTFEDVKPAPAGKGVVAGAAEDEVVGEAGPPRLVGVASEDDVAAGARRERLVRLAAEDDVVAGPGVDGVVALAGEDDVVPGAGNN